MPKVSVCIPTHNTGRHLGDAVGSVLKQTFTDFELIICDNSSTDNTPTICQSYTDARLRYVHYDQYVGQGGNWNRCLELSRGQYVVLLHADDMLLPAFLTRAVAVLDAHPEVGLVHCAAKHFDETGDVLYLQKRYDDDRVESGEVLLREIFMNGCVICPAGVMVRQSVYKDVGCFTEKVRWGIDQHMWARIALRYNTAYIAEPMALYRQHAQSGTSEVLATASNGLDDLWVTKDIFSKIPEERKDLHALRRQAIYQVAHRAWCMAESMSRSGHIKAARLGVWRAVQVSPRMLLQAKVWGLWFASFFGHKYFERLRCWKKNSVGIFEN